MLRCVEVVNAGKTKVMIMNGEEGLEHVVHIDGVHLEYSNIWDVFLMKQVQMEGRIGGE